ncbi:integumentary mucin A.1-like [Chironomus tepperi]|uniref:integumentary mucin A.1-like n=1 Tax=Chironomus tepperi TaxID=113505 RepID=UPI00391F256F
MKIILAVLFGIIACATAQTCTDPSAPRQIFVHPTDCSRYIICAFGRELTYLCPAHINHFNACTMNCTATNDMCFTCVDVTTIGTTTTVVDGTTTTAPEVTTVTDEPTFIPTPPAETTPEPITTTTVAEDTTISVPTAPVIPPTPPIVP